VRLPFFCIVLRPILRRLFFLAGDGSKDLVTDVAKADRVIWLQENCDPSRRKVRTRVIVEAFQAIEISQSDETFLEFDPDP
jgi:helix-turn-helix protein